MQLNINFLESLAAKSDKDGILGSCSKSKNIITQITPYFVRHNRSIIALTAQASPYQVMAEQTISRNQLQVLFTSERFDAFCT